MLLLIGIEPMMICDPLVGGDEESGGARTSQGSAGTYEGGLDEFELDVALTLGKEWNAAANQHRADHNPVLVDQAQRGRLGGEGRAADRDVVLPRLGSQPLDLLSQTAGGQAGISLHRRERGGEHHLRERIPERNPFELRLTERRILVGGLQYSIVSYNRRPNRWTSTSRISSIQKRKTSSSGAVQSNSPSGPTM